MTFIKATNQHILYFLLKGNLWMTINHAKQNMPPSIHLLKQHTSNIFLSKSCTQNTVPYNPFSEKIESGIFQPNFFGPLQWYQPKYYHNWGHLPQLKHLMVTSGGIVEVDAPEEQNTWKTNDIQKWPRRRLWRQIDQIATLIQRCCCCCCCSS